MSISQKVLKSLELSSDLLIQIDGLRYLPYKMIWGSSLQGFNRNSVQATLSRNIKQGFVKKRIDQGQAYLALTELGETFLRRKENRAVLKLHSDGNKWDGVYRFILFDIPEKDRVVRDVLRRALVALGAVCWQKSVWVTKENITRELNEFIEANNLLDYCSVLEVKEVYSPKLKSLLERSN